MKLRFLIGLVFLFSTRVSAFELPFMVSVNGESCVLDAEGVKCWRRDGGKLDDIPELKSPTQLSVGWAHDCALDADGVKCWGYNDQHQTDVPALKSPIQVAAGWWHTCALDTDGVKCWGNNSDGQLNVPVLKSPIQISAGIAHTCALDAEGVKCWGNNGFERKLEVPKLKSPTQVSAGAEHTCAIDTEGVKCWGKNEYGQIDVPVLKSPTQVSSGHDHTCALDTEGVKCWGGNRYGQSDVPELKSPIQVSAGNTHTCVIDAEGVKCWGFNPQVNMPAFVFDIVEPAIPYVTSPRAEYLNALPKLQIDLKSKLFYLKYLLVSPAILSMDSSYFTQGYVPKFKRTMEWFQNNFGYKRADIREIPDAEEHRKLVVHSIQSALSVSLHFMSPDQQDSLQKSLRAAGLAIAEPMNNQKIRELVKQIDALKSEKLTLKASPKSAFLVDSLELAANWLREKVK